MISDETNAYQPTVYALYPESNQRTLEEMDLLFAAPTPWAWDAEKTFARLKEERDAAGEGLEIKKKFNSAELVDNA